ncbi:response regulator [Novosphingobium beihaiensis]|uniref:Response regulator n=1 Tax=Novosphingobium beihaiensis TaxID=2930389 RepID=A0ABT0BLK9_9SPHN|nr:response regulator [Novosphingobium beihaiensis]MCJ2185946.1 response regulator [Novosphingobium beihaiensis]
MKQPILIVEDEQEIAEVLIAYVTRAGFEVARAASVDEAIRMHAQLRPQLVLLDIGLPGGDGIEVLTAIRRRFETPVIMVSAVQDDITKLSSLRIGADDYVLKPFNPAEVVERIRVVLRRTSRMTGQRTLAVGKLLVELDERLATYRDAEMDRDVHLPLTPAEFAILAHMARQPRRAFSRAELLEAALPDSDAYDRVIDSHLSKLRHKLAAAGCTDLIEAVRGIGYRLCSDVAVKP